MLGMLTHPEQTRKLRHGRRRRPPKQANSLGQANVTSMENGIVWVGRRAKFQAAWVAAYAAKT
jgi:hypothetical protein